jgi:hypothetical protein
MKKLLSGIFATILMVVGFVSCSSSDSEGDSATNYEILAAKYDISGSSTYKSIELTKQGQYIITLNSTTTSSKGIYTFAETNGTTRSGSMQIVYTGTYTTLDNNTYNLNDFGIIKLNTSAGNAEVNNIEVTPTGGTTVIVNASKVATMAATSATNKLCRTWDLKFLRLLQTTYGTTTTSTYNAVTGIKTGIFNKINPWQLIFTPNGTFCSIYTTDPKMNTNETWSWLTDGDSIKIGETRVTTSFKGDSLTLTINETYGSTKEQYIETYYPATVTITPNISETSVNGKTGMLSAMGISSPIKQITEASNKDTVTLSYSNNNLMSILWKEYQGSTYSYYSKNTFTYSPLVITSQNNDAGDISTVTSTITEINTSGYITSMNSTTNAGGQMIGMKSTMNYTADGHLSKVTMNSETYNITKYITYTWNNDNITKVVATSTGTYDGETQTETATYTFNYVSGATKDNGLFYVQIVSTLNEFVCYCSNDQNPMFYAGMLGLKPANIPTAYSLNYSLTVNGKTEETSTGTVDISTQADANGRVTKLIEAMNYSDHGINNNKTYENIISYE